MGKSLETTIEERNILGRFGFELSPDNGGKEWWTVREVQQQVLNDHPDLDAFRDQKFVEDYLQGLTGEASGGDGTPAGMEEGGRFHQDIVLALVMEVEAELGEKGETLPEVAESAEELMAQWLLVREPAADPVGFYIREAAQTPLLTVDQEVELAKQVELGVKAREILKQGSKLGLEEEQQYQLQVEEGQKAREHLARANTRFVVSIAKRYMGQGLPFPDLIQEGNIGLMRAVDKFDYRRGNRFATYAGWWIRQAITRAISQKSRTIRIPTHLVDRVNALSRVAGQLEQELGRPASTEEVRERMAVTEAQFAAATEVAGQQTVYLEEPIGDGRESELGDFIPSEIMGPEEAVIRRLLAEDVERVISDLLPRQAQILRFRFGLGGRETLSLEEVGRRFGLSRERIRQIEKEALRQLRQPRVARILGDYL